MKNFTLLLLSIFTVLSITAQTRNGVAMIGVYKDYSDLTINGDDDEIAAAEWFITSKIGKYYGVEELYNSLSGNNTIDLNSLEAIWIMIDQEEPVSIDDFLQNYTGGANGFRNATVLNALTEYYKNGGNILLTNHANVLLKELGRYSLYPGLCEFGSGSNNNDLFDAGVVYGTWAEAPITFDNSSDKLFSHLDITTENRPNGREYKVFHLMSEGWKENHNCFWYFDNSDLPAEFPNKANDDAAKFDEIYNQFKATPLATWPHIEDYLGGAIVRWEPTNEYKGTCITIGFAAYEWNMNIGTNRFDNNIRQLTFNALSELAPGVTSGVDGMECETTEIPVKVRYYNIQGMEVSRPENGGVYIVVNEYASGRTSAGKIRLK